MKLNFITAKWTKSIAALIGALFFLFGSSRFFEHGDKVGGFLNLGIGLCCLIASVLIYLIEKKKSSQEKS